MVYPPQAVQAGVKESSKHSLEKATEALMAYGCTFERKFLYEKSSLHIRITGSSVSSSLEYALTRVVYISLLCLGLCGLHAALCDAARALEAECQSLGPGGGHRMSQ